MENKMKTLKYAHPSACGYDVTKSYLLEDLKKELSFEQIKVMFEPINFSWDEVEVKKEVSKKLNNE